MLGGGTFTSQNKILPGSYINFVSQAKATADVGDRGIVSIALELNWCADNEIMKITKADFEKNTMELFGYPYAADEMADIRDIFLNARILYLYRLNSGGKKAENTMAAAKYTGTRGNDITIVVQKNVDNDSNYDVKTYLGTYLADTQTVTKASDLKENAFVTWKDTELTVTAGTKLEGGSNGEVTGQSHSDYLALAESYAFNCMGTKSEEESVKKLYVQFTKRMREDVGVKFQTVLYNIKADTEGVINVKNASAVIPWLIGAQGGCLVNASCTNKLYDGEAVIDANYTQAQLESAVTSGELVFHNVDGEIRILEDINSLTTLTDEKGEIFRSNQSIRVMDQIANDIALLFKKKYLGAIPNDKAGRVSLWLDIVKHHQALNDMRAIEDFADSDVVVEEGESKKAVVVSDKVTIVNAMEWLYMTVVVE